MRKIRAKILPILFLIFLVIVLYTVWDNNRFIIARQEIKIDHLPEQLNGFRILQVSDLHEKQFGENQNRLIESINSIDYDAIVFTGDMLDDVESTNYDSFFTLIEGIDNKENALYIPGNTDPANYQIDRTVEKSEFIQGMEERGVQLLESIYSVPVDGKNVHFIHFELSILKDPEYMGSVRGISKPDYMNEESYLLQQETLWEELSSLEDRDEADVLIALNHYPIPDIRIDHIQANPELVWPDYDLIMAGHYHGGQIRLPFIGALFIPEPWYEPNSLFPPQGRVKGLWEYSDTKQYVSAGLGSSGAVPFMKFRLFNPPEINLVILRGAVNGQ
ncbi:metallophosphoesterase [Oceanobacillus neutriphilus]|uniref:Metallophosphoesterase YkuE n=1 Tax=Oceanobacillus neutriphilus TaxID=531815 RepID=A0ABQ2NYX4_9BACI|nr:metallophosphoesterase [Oceanobacillus neutriphilus]GGP14005.1 putative metallophosphoesterase YkuE [Oceanobacillus neutriphilus]